MIRPEILLLNTNLIMIWMASASAQNFPRNQVCSHTPRTYPKLQRKTWLLKHVHVSVQTWHMEVSTTMCQAHYCVAVCLCYVGSR